MIRFLPGLTGAIAAFALLLFIGWMDSVWLRATLFIAVYLVVTIATDRAMSTYRRI